MESGENPEQTRCGNWSRFPNMPIFTKVKVKAGKRFGARSPNTSFHELPFGLAESELQGCRPFRVLKGYGKSRENSMRLTRSRSAIREHNITNEIIR